MSTPNEEVGGLLDVIATEEPGGIPENKNAEAPESESSKTTEPEEELGDDTQDHSRLPVPEPETEEVAEPSKTEEAAEAAVEDDWTPILPPELPPFNLPAPQFNEEGFITNMDAAQYQQYIVEKAKYEMKQEMHGLQFENQALDAAEKILPEIKTNPSIRSMVENIRVASILTGKQVNSYEAAKQVKEALGLSQTKVAAARAEGERNAKSSITVQKKAALQTNGSSQPAPNKAKNRELSQRLNRGDTDAYAELFDIWQEEGKL